MKSPSDLKTPSALDREYLPDSRADAAIRRRARGVAGSLTHLGPRRPAPNGSTLRSIGSQRNFASCMVMFGRFLEANKAGNFNGYPQDAPEVYLFARSLRVSEAQLKLDHWALELFTGVKLPKFKPANPQILDPRAYTNDQIDQITAHQTPEFAYSTRLAVATGMRGMELISIGRMDEQPIHVRPRPELVHSFLPPGRLYSTVGKGGLIRSVHVPLPFIAELEGARRSEPVEVTHVKRKVFSFYAIRAGRAWADSFAHACRRVFGSTAGAHGCRHKFAKERLYHLMRCGVDELTALKVVSVELGHFRPSIVQTYLRAYWAP